MPPFHLAFPVTDIEATRTFFGSVLGCEIGRSAERWIDFNFFGHQITAHLRQNESGAVSHSAVDGDQVPVPHFGAILPEDQWRGLIKRIEEHQVNFLIEPRIRFEGLPGEQGTFFIKDPSGNALEFKFFHSSEQVFET